MVDNESTRGKDDPSFADRASYIELKEWFLGNYYDGCCSLGVQRNWSRRKVILHIHSDFVSSFNSPIEIFLVHFIALVLTGGWDREEEAYYRAQALEQLSRLADIDFTEVFSGEEKDELFRDLRIMGIMDLER